jgi:hypothetical protein
MISRPADVLPGVCMGWLLRTGALHTFTTRCLLLLLLLVLLLLLLLLAGIQKLHIRTVPLGEQPRRIAHQPSSKSLGVVTISTPAGANPSELAGTADHQDTLSPLCVSYLRALCMCAACLVRYIQTLAHASRLQHTLCLQLKHLINSSALTMLKRRACR